MFDAISKQWQTLYGPLGQQGPASNTDSGTPQSTSINFGDLGYTPDKGDFMGSGGLNDQFLSNLGWTGGNPYINSGAGQTTDGGQAPGAAGGYTPEFQQFVQDKGLAFQSRAGQNPNQTILGAFGQDGNQVGTDYTWRPVNDDAFGLAALGATGFAGAAASGAFSGAGAFGSGAPEGAAVDAGGYPVSYSPYNGAGSEGFQVAGDNVVAPEGWGSSGASVDGAGGIGNAEGAYPAGLGSVPSGGSSVGNVLGDAQSWMKANPGLTNIGGGLVNGLIGAYSSGRALNAQTNATNQANALLKPYSDTGVAALGRLNGLMSNPGSITSDPGYQFGLSQGTQGIDRSAASKGGLYSGATLKALDRYGTDYAGTKLNDAYARYGGVAQLGATGTTNMANNLTGLGNAAAGASLYTGNVAQNGVNNALGQLNYANGGYGNNQLWNQSSYNTKP